MNLLLKRTGADFFSIVEEVHAEAEKLYPSANPDVLTTYVVQNASRRSFVVLNSERDKKSAGDRPTEPTCPFTVIIGGNIVSRGVTFPNLLAMYFTRDVKTKLQQDTYIQRARMFGARGSYLQHFELTIPSQLYADWSRCFLFHRLALETIKNNKASPVWLGDPRISIAASSSIDRGTVDLNKGEISFQLFNLDDPAKIDSLIKTAPEDIATLKKIAKIIGDAMPEFLINYIKNAIESRPGKLAIHESFSIENYKSEDVNHDAISRRRGFIGRSQLELSRFPSAVHHIKILYNSQKKARVFYKNLSGIQFIENQGPEKKGRKKG